MYYGLIFFKQKTAYELRISDWSSDVCSSDLLYGLLEARSELLVQRLAEPGRGGVSEVSEFLLLKTINRYRGALWHAQQLETLHPERLFHDFLMLASTLATFSAEGRRQIGTASCRARGGHDG